jgi:SpoVK/Ycf46/Vps4 family AAA+-type ATPase
VLWIDEIEGGFAGYGAKGESDSGRIFASFLTWMQEKRNQVFVAATANRIDLLPPEILRKGRFDQIFFVDLPTSAERERIFKIHLSRRGNEMRSINLNQLAAATKGFNGAECEQVVVSAMFDAFAQKRPVNMQDLFRAISNTVPLSKTMYERIKEIKKWAHDRAINASTDVERERI